MASLWRERVACLFGNHRWEATGDMAVNDSVYGWRPIYRCVNCPKNETLTSKFDYLVALLRRSAVPHGR